MKTPEEIKADAATCLTKPPHAMCDRFDLNKKCKGDCSYVIKELYDLVLHYESRLAQVERERDAAVFDIHTVLHNRGIDADCMMCNMKKPECNWECEKAEWRGVCPENAKED